MAKEIKRTEKKVCGTSISDFLKQQKDKIKAARYKCPLCGESFEGISAFGSHLKSHCT